MGKLLDAAQAQIDQLESAKGNIKSRWNGIPFLDQGTKDRKAQEEIDQLSGRGNEVWANWNQAKEQEANQDRQNQVQQQQQGVANNFRQNLGDFKEKQMNLASAEAKKNLAEQLGNVNTAANQRGLLYSGLRQGAEAGSRGQMASQMAAQKQGINQAADATANQLDQQAASAGLNTQAMDTESMNNLYNQALQKRQLQRGQNQSNAQNVGSAIQGGAGLLGTVAGAFK